MELGISGSFHPFFYMYINKYDYVHMYRHTQNTHTYIICKYIYIYTHTHHTRLKTNIDVEKTSFPEGFSPDIFHIFRIFKARADESARTAQR